MAQGKATCSPRGEGKGRKGPFCTQKRDKERGIKRRPSSDDDPRAGVGTSSLEECWAGEEGAALDGPGPHLAGRLHALIFLLIWKREEQGWF